MQLPREEDMLNADGESRLALKDAQGKWTSLTRDAIITDVCYRVDVNSSAILSLLLESSPPRRLASHLRSHVPVSSAQYDALPWYKRIFARRPTAKSFVSSPTDHTMAPESPSAVHDTEKEQEKEGEHEYEDTLTQDVPPQSHSSLDEFVRRTRRARTGCCGFTYSQCMLAALCVLLVLLLTLFVGMCVYAFNNPAPSTSDSSKTPTDGSGAVPEPSRPTDGVPTVPTTEQQSQSAGLYAFTYYTVFSAFLRL